MEVQPISAERARKMLESGDVILVDIREPDEYARERIPGARSEPLSSIGSAPLAVAGASSVIFCCRSGARTAANASLLARDLPCSAYVLDGGLDAWKRAGFSVQINRKRPIELMRQVQIVAGGITLAAVVLGATLQPAFYFLAALVGAGLVFAGVTGTCAMAKLLRSMPWNRVMLAPSAPPSVPSQGPKSST